MATFFDASNPAHVNRILPADLRKATELPQVADDVESEIVARYTRRMTREFAYYNFPQAYLVDLGVASDDYSYVMLRGYAAALEDVDPGLSQAMLNTIVLIITWRLRWLRRDPAVHSQHSTEGKFIRYRADAFDRFPQDWDLFLRPYDLRMPVTYV